MKKTLLLLLVLILGACSSKPPYRPEVTQFLDEHPEIRVFYLYESTLRMLNMVFEGSFEDAFASVDQVRLGISMGEESAKIAPGLRDLYTKMENEGAELLFSLRRNGTTSAAYQTDKSGNGYLLCLSDAHSAVLIEISGQMSLKDIQNLSTMDFKKISTVFDISPESEEKEAASPADSTNANPKENI